MAETVSTSVTNIRKKLFGTSALVAVMVAALIMSSGSVSALFKFIDGKITVTGTVIQVHGSSLELDTGGTHPFEVIVDASTQYKNGIGSLSDLEIGKTVKMIAREDQGNILAEVLSHRVGSGYGYGHGCEELNLTNVYISAIESNKMVLSRSGITFNVSYSDATQIIGSSLADLYVGQVVTVIGSDCADEGFAASKVMVFTDDPVAMCDAHSEMAFVVYNDNVLLSHDAGGAYSPVIGGLEIPAGKYDVYGVSFDKHSVHTWDTSTLEQWYATGWTDGEVVYTTGTTNDLPDTSDRNKTMIGSSVMIDSSIDSIQFVHANYPEPNYNSILPECIVFEPAGDDHTDMVLSCKNVPSNAMVFSNDRPLLSHDEGGAFIEDVPFAVDPEVSYDVYGVSYDHHSENPWDTSNLEEWYFDARSDAGESVFMSNTTEDLPDNLDRNVSMIGAGVNFADATSMTLVHANYPNPDYHSVVPECVVVVPSQQ